VWFKASGGNCGNGRSHSTRAIRQRAKLPPNVRPWPKPSARLIGRSLSKNYGLCPARVNEKHLGRGWRSTEVHCPPGKNCDAWSRGGDISATATAAWQHAQGHRQRRAPRPAARKSRNPAIASALMDGSTQAGADLFAFIGTCCLTAARVQSTFHIPRVVNVAR